MSGWLAVLAWLRRCYNGVAYTVIGFFMPFLAFGDIGSWVLRIIFFAGGILLFLHGIELLKAAKEDFRDRYK